MKINCVVCDKEFNVLPYRIKIGRGKCCSLKCDAIRRKNLAAPRKTRMVSDPVKRFWSQVDKDSSPDGCWIWTGDRDSWGYGKFSIFTDGKWKSVKTNRYAAELVVGKLPEGVQALHACDRPLCVLYGPGHIFLGSHAENMADKVRKGRQPRGEVVVNSKLTEMEVRQIRERLSMGESCVRVARDLGVSKPTILNVYHRRTWKHVL